MFGLDMETFYQSETPFEVFVLFHNGNDGCTYSCQSVISIYLTKEDAEDGLLKYIELAERLEAGNQEFQKRYDECYECYKSSTTYDEYVKIVLQRCSSFEEVAELYNKLKDSITWRTKEETAKTISRIAEEHKQWRLKNFGHDFKYPLDTNINNYEIESVRIGEIR